MKNYKLCLYVLGFNSNFPLSIYLIHLAYGCFLCDHRSGQFVWEDHRPPSGVWKGTNGGEVISFSGCDDDQTSVDTSVMYQAFYSSSFDLTRLSTLFRLMHLCAQALSKITSTGAMTYSFIKAIEGGNATTYGNMLNAMRSTIRNTDNNLGGSVVTSLLTMLLTGQIGGSRQVCFSLLP